MAGKPDGLQTRGDSRNCNSSSLSYLRAKLASPILTSARADVKEVVLLVFSSYAQCESVCHETVENKVGWSCVELILNVKQSGWI